MQGLYAIFKQKRQKTEMFRLYVTDQKIGTCGDWEDGVKELSRKINTSIRQFLTWWWIYIHIQSIWLNTEIKKCLYYVTTRIKYSRVFCWQFSMKMPLEKWRFQVSNFLLTLLCMYKGHQSLNVVPFSANLFFNMFTHILAISSKIKII